MLLARAAGRSTPVRVAQLSPSFARFVHVMAELSHRVIANGGSKARPYTKHI
jgi:hypothetical protein